MLQQLLSVPLPHLVLKLWNEILVAQGIKYRRVLNILKSRLYVVRNNLKLFIMNELKADWFRHNKSTTQVVRTQQKYPHMIVFF